MTSLLTKYADEIANEMTKTLENDGFVSMFKQASMEKTAGVALEAFKRDVDVAIEQGTDVNLVYTKHLGLLQKEENVEAGTIEKAREYMASKAVTPEHRQPGQVMPEADDECMSSDCMETMADDKTIIAADFALNNLAKIADTLDGQGFEKLASIIDEAMVIVAAVKKDKPPRKWVKEKTKEVKENKRYKDADKEKIEAVVGKMWKKLTDKEKEKVRKQYA